jgi:hypothetical protein
VLWDSVALTLLEKPSVVKDEITNWADERGRMMKDLAGEVGLLAHL